MPHDTDKEAEFVYAYGPRLKRLLVSEAVRCDKYDITIKACVLLSFLLRIARFGIY